MKITYIVLSNLAGATCSLLAFALSLAYFYTSHKAYLLSTACLQSLFIMEVVNIQLNNSKSRYAPTLMQLATRTFHLWVVSYYYAYTSPHFPILIGCWYLSDFLRYLIYSFKNILLKKIGYSIFLITYPLASCLEMYAIYFLMKTTNGLVRYAFLAVLIAYIPSFLFLMKHRIQQRYWANRKHEERHKKTI